jgi:ABC-2 type transport system permease protein
MVSGLYFPAIGVQSPFPFAIQAVASLIPLTIGMDALRKSLFGGNDVGSIWPSLVTLAVMAVVFLVISDFALKILENKGRRDGTIAVRIR